MFLLEGIKMTKKELVETLKDYPDDAKICVYPEDDNVHLPNVFVKDVYCEDYEDLGYIIDLVI